MMNFVLKNEKLCIKNEELCIKSRIFMFSFKLMDFAGDHREGRCRERDVLRIAI